MKIIFLSNFLNHHQIPFCESMVTLCDEFYFVQTQKVDDERLSMGYSECEDRYPYILCSYKDKQTQEKVDQLIDKADFVIIGSAPESLIQKRLDQNKPVLRYSEPFMREQNWRQFTPKSMLYKFERHTKYAFRKVYALCCGCYAASDFATFGAYIGKTYKWGYFPKTITYDIDTLMVQKRKPVMDIVWVGRFLELKHPEMILQTAKRLKQQNYDFHINIIGSGQCEGDMKSFIKKNDLSAHVELLGNMSPDQVRGYMEKANIFMFNSDYREGWGAVVNEAMNSGCAVIVSQGPGCTGYLIEHGQNGLVYDFKSFESLYKNVKILFDNKALCEKLGKNAYQTIIKTWNAKTASQNLISLLKTLSGKQKHTITYGPCSQAKITPRRSMFKRMLTRKNLK